MIYKHACALGCEGIVEATGLNYRSGRANHWIKSRTRQRVRREAEEDCGDKRARGGDKLRDE